MAGTVTVAREAIDHQNKQGVGERIIISWTSDASGNVSGTKVLIRGLVMRMTTKPDGTDVPTDNYDITLPDPQATTLDLAQSLLLNRDTANSEVVNFSATAALTNGSPIYINGAIDFTVANAGNAKKGTLILEVLH
jgi:hypothetical protein